MFGALKVADIILKCQGGIIDYYLSKRVATLLGKFEIIPESEVL